MLVVTINKDTRFELRDESGAIGVLQVVSLGCGRVRVALDFPRTVEIWRGENAEAIAARRAAGGKPNGKAGT